MTKPAVSCPRVPPPEHIPAPSALCRVVEERAAPLCAPGVWDGVFGGCRGALGLCPGSCRGAAGVVGAGPEGWEWGQGVLCAPVKAPGAPGRRGGRCSQQGCLCSFGVGRASLTAGLWAAAGCSPAGTGIGGWGQPEVTCGVFVCPSLQHRRCRAGLAGMGTRQLPGASSSPVPMQLGQFGGPKLAPTSPQAQAAQTPSAPEQSDLGTGQKHPGVGQGPGRAAPAPQNPPTPHCKDVRRGITPLPSHCRASLGGGSGAV